MILKRDPFSLLNPGIMFVNNYFNAAQIKRRRFECKIMIISGNCSLFCKLYVLNSLFNISALRYSSVRPEE